MKEYTMEWAFTEILGEFEHVKATVRELKERNLIQGTLCSKEERKEKLFVQLYKSGKDVRRLTPEEQAAYNEIAHRNHVYIEYTYKGKESQNFPTDEEEDFLTKYYEWW